MGSLVCLVFLLEIVEDIAYTESATRHLVGVCRTYALACSTHLVLALRGFDGSVEHTVCGHNEMSLLRDVQTALKVVSALLKILSLLHEEVGSEYHAVADDVDLASLENA